MILKTESSSILSSLCRLFNSRLSCSRNTLHTQLFLSYAFRAIFSLLKSGYLALSQPTEAEVEEVARSLLERQLLQLRNNHVSQAAINQSLQELVYGNGTEGLVEEEVVEEPPYFEVDFGELEDSLEWNCDWTIRVIQLLCHYFIISNHSWLMMEGYYLHRILFNPLREKCSMKNIKRFGWCKSFR